MKRVLILMAALALATGAAFAGDYHTGATLVCSDCHTMHASMQHSYTGSTSGYPQSWTPHEYLLKGPVNDLCLSCHDAQSFAPDVLAGNQGPARTTGRSAGALNKQGVVINSYDTWMGHTLGATSTAPGTAGSFVPDASSGLTCVDCHHHHGFAGSGARDVKGNTVSSAYRNLRGLSADPDGDGTLNTINVSYTISFTTPPADLTKDVWEKTASAYEQDDVNLMEPVTTDSGFATWCTRCHVNFHGAVGDTNSVGGQAHSPAGYEKFIRHPQATVNIGEVGGGHSSNSRFTGKSHRVRVMSANGTWGTQGSAWTGPPTDLTPTCLSCHKAHGNLNAFGLIYALGNAALGEQGDGTAARDLCRQCHVQGGP